MFSLLIVTLILAAITLAALVSIANAHDWYPYSCCSNQDCQPVADEQIQITPDGYRLQDGTVIRYRDAKPSPDGRYHVCRYQSTGRVILDDERKPCFWAPVGAS